MGFIASLCLSLLRNRVIRAMILNATIKIQIVELKRKSFWSTVLIVLIVVVLESTWISTPIKILSIQTLGLICKFSKQMRKFMIHCQCLEEERVTQQNQLINRHTNRRLINLFLHLEDLISANPLCSERELYWIRLKLKKTVKYIRMENGLKPS